MQNLKHLVNSNFEPPYLLGNPHMQTLLPQYFHSKIQKKCQRLRIDTEDGDFLDLDYYAEGYKKLAIISHGLEGHSKRYYVREYAEKLLDQKFDVIAWNMRGCSGVPNKLLRFYHSGESQDLSTVIQYAKDRSLYQEISLIGFSVGGNITLKLLGELGAKAQNLIKSAVTFSVPCDLRGSAQVLAKFKNKLYMRYFMHSLKAKLQEKNLRFPGSLDLSNLDRIKNFCQFDENFTAPLHGFRDAEDYWACCSANLYIPEIKVPTLLVTSIDDPFLSESCFPVEHAKHNRFFKLELCKYGGHMGFLEGLRPRSVFSLKTGLDFLQGPKITEGK